MSYRNPVEHYGKPLIGIVLAVVSLAAAALQWGGESFRISGGLWTAIIAVHWVVICYLLWLAFDFRKNQFALPTVKSFQADSLTILTSKKDWLGMGTAVSVYREDAEFEKLLCAGEVINLQQNDLVAIQLAPAEFGVVDQASLITQINSAGVSQLIVRPGLMKRLYDA